MLVHHTVGLRQQLGKAKLHLDANCRYLRRGVGLFSEDIPESSIAPKRWCRGCRAATKPASVAYPTEFAG